MRPDRSRERSVTKDGLEALGASASATRGWEILETLCKSRPRGHFCCVSFSKPFFVSEHALARVPSAIVGIQ